ncbi:MAG: 50S ribosomal protein L22 [Flavobacteriales bacterium]|nr:50S ribosomal protein L22 [Flavobacteriales bacterium]
MEARAILRNCPMSPRKMRLVADQIRGAKVGDALNMLRFNQKPMYAKYMEKLLISAIANYKQATDGTGNEEDLVVFTVTVDGGRMLKRITPAPQGRAHRVRKRSNHITLVVSDLQEDVYDEEEYDEDVEDLEEVETEE